MLKVSCLIYSKHNPSFDTETNTTMNDYSYILKQAVPTEKMRTIVSTMIPQLVRWAQNGQTDKTYRDMIHILNYERWSGIGRALGYVEDVMQALRKASGRTDIPSLNALCKNSKTNLPSDGFSYVYKGYDLLPENEKPLFVEGVNQKAVKYEYWGEVLDALGLQPAKVITTEELTSLMKHIMKPVHGSGGEGKEHKAIKEYIRCNPQVIGITNIKTVETERSLPSGDQVDVYFTLNDGTHIAVEVKPFTSPDHDVLRGIFQCVKYDATINAYKKINSEIQNVQTFLVVGKDLSSTNQVIANELGVTYIVVKMDQSK